jgi:hypothetical protein
MWFTVFENILLYDNMFPFCIFSPDRFHAQNVAISEFRKFATSKNVHVTIVIHPRKVG